MPKVTQLPFINSGTTATSFFVVDDRATRRLRYTDFVDRVIGEVQQADFRGPTGPAGPASTVPGPTGPIGYTGSAGVGLPIGGTTGQVLAKVSDTDYIVEWADAGSGTGVGLSTRSVVSGNTGSLTAGNTFQTTITGFKSYFLFKIETDYPAWVRLYSDSASRTADLTRTEDQDPLPGSGIIAEVITSSGNLSQLITPGVVGFNNDSVVSSAMYLTVTNKDVVSRNITINLTILQLEA